MIKDYDFFLFALFCVLWIITRVSRQVKVGSGSLGFINPDQTIPEPVSPSLSYWCSYETAGDWERGGTCSYPPFCLAYRSGKGICGLVKPLPLIPVCLPGLHLPTPVSSARVYQSAFADSLPLSCLLVRLELFLLVSLLEFFVSLLWGGVLRRGASTFVDGGKATFFPHCHDRFGRRRGGLRS